MPVIQSLDRQGIRLAAGYNAGAVFEGSATSVSSGATNLIDTKVRGADNDHNGKWIIITSGTLDGETTRVTDWVSSTNTFTVSPVFSGTPANGITYELWEREYRPESIHNFINQAVHHVSGKAYDPEEDTSLHLHGDDRQYPTPSVFAAISKLEKRVQVGSVSIDPCESGWTEQSNVTQSFDQTRKREGGASLRLIVAAAAGADADIASKTISSLDISQYDTLEFWMLSSVAISTAGDIRMRLTSSSTTVSLNIPTVSANIWTYHRITYTADEARQLSDVTGIVIRQNTDIGAVTIWFDDIKVVQNFTAKWEKISPRLWYADKEEGRLHFNPSMGTIPYNLLKITGGDELVLLNADSTVTQVDPSYMIAFTSYLLLMVAREGTDTERSDRRNLALFWRQEAENRIRSFPALVDYRQVR
jgi:hypothetical protein